MSWHDCCMFCAGLSFGLTLVNLMRGSACDVTAAGVATIMWLLSAGIEVWPR